MKTIKKFLVTSSILAFPMVLISGVSVALAATSIVAPVTTAAGIQSLICNIIGWFFWFILVLSVIMVLVAAFDYVTAGDDTEKTTRGRRRLTYAAVGIVIALLAFVFPTIVSSLFNGTGLFNLNTTSCITS